MTTPKMTGMTPKMAGLTPNSHGIGSFGFSPSLLGQSPATLLAKHRSPIPSANLNSPGILAALGVDLRGTAMNVGGSIGTPQMPQLPPDENKKRELAEILRLLSSRPGRISISAVERLAKGMGLECYKEETDTPGITRLSLAAKIFLLDIEHSGNKIHHVQLNFENTPGQSGGLAPQAAAIFQRNLIPEFKTPGKIPLLSPSLADFSDNLNRLYRTDRLSTSLNCFTAITGIYQSLQRIYEFEKNNMGGEVMALSFGNGRPRMHTRGKVGLSIDYWRERRLVATESSDDDHSEEGERFWRVLIEVEEMPPDFGTMSINTITPVRTTTHWVSDEVEKPKEDNLFGDIEELTTDWLEPPLEELMDVAGDPSQSRPPSARFVARLDPPVSLPWQEEHAIHPGLMLGPDGPLESLILPNLSPNESMYRRIYVPNAASTSGLDEMGDGALHRYQLQNSHLKPVLARQVSEIPFSHPRDLLKIFQTLRQYALLTTLLESCFASPASSTHPPLQADKDHKTNVWDSLSLFLQDDNPETVPGHALPVDVALEPEHGFGVRLVYPDKSCGIVNMQLHVGKNAELKVHMDAGGLSVDSNVIAKALRASEDIGLVLEWIRQQQ